MVLFKVNKIAFSFFLLIISLILFDACKTKTNIESKKLAKTYCGSCHQFPEPNLLPKNVWQYSTLPYMGILMGITDEVTNLPDPLKPYSILKPDNQLISKSDWEKIKAYYLDESPTELDFEDIEPLENLENLFSVEKIDTKLANTTIPNFTMISVDQIKKRIIASDQSNRYIWEFDEKGKPNQIIKEQNALTGIKYLNDGKLLMNFMGKTTQANQEVAGSSLIGSISNNSIIINNILLENLNRPVTTESLNFDDQPDNELLVTEFGFKNSGLSVWKLDKTGKYIKKYLSNTTGAIKTIIKDLNNDKKPDIIAQFAQGDERIVTYLNKGNLNFDEKLLLRFPPIYGSSSFEMVDIDSDGNEDIIYSAGDNADFTTILKPYHGVYIFKNKGGNSFKNIHFFHQNGAYKTISKDFDMDGDIDIVSISLFPDVGNRPKEGFIYFENNNGKFIQKTLDINHLGRWAVMDAGDLDADGDIDLVLGSHPVAKFPAGFDQAWKLGSGLVILRNNSAKK